MMFAERWYAGSGSAAELAVGLLAASLLVVGGCKEKTDEQASASKAKQKKQKQREDDEFVAGSEAKHFTFALESEPESLDPTKISGVPGGRIAFNIFEGLLMPAQTTTDAEGPKDLVRPGVAEDYEVSDDGTTYTFHLRENAKWSNGEPVSAKDFVFSWKRTLLPGYPADYAQLFYVIEGVSEYNNEKTESKWKDVGIKAPDEQTIEITLEHPTPYFPELVAFYTFFPQPKKPIKAHGGKWTDPENIVTNGPYKLAKHDEGERLVLEKNPHYWDADNVSIEKAQIRIIEDADKLVEEYENEKLHWTGRSLTPWQVPELKDRPGFHEEHTLGTYYVRVNVSDDESFRSNPKFARALRLAVDRKKLVNETLNGVFTVADSFVPDEMPEYASNVTIEKDVDKAKKLIKELGVPSGDKLGTIELLYSKGKLHERVAKALKRQWKQSLGLKIELESKSWKDYLEALDITAYELARSGWVGDYNDPMTFLDMWTSDSGNNDTGWANEEYDKYIAAAKSAKKSPERVKHLLQAEGVLLENGPVVPIYHYAAHVLVGPNVEGYEEHNRNIHLLKDLSVGGGGGK